jgi:RimJ/RimL family protein N-acetyltransferase
MKPLKKLSYLNGTKVYLRPFLKTDLTKSYLQWINDYHNTSFLEAGKFPVSEYELLTYYKKNIDSKNSIFFAICNNKKKHIGNALINNIDWVNRRCSYGRLIGDIKNSPVGAGTEVLQLLQKYVFFVLNLNTMWTAVCSKNFSSIKSNIKSGMNSCGNINEFFYRDNKYYECTFFYINRKQYLRNNQSLFNK